MRAKHTPHTLEAFPIYSCAFVSPRQVVLGGGGGQSRSGIKNKLRLYQVESDKVIDLLHELELEKGEDAPMSMAAHPGSSKFVCGINSSQEHLNHGENQNCRLFGVEQDRISLVETRSTLTLTTGVDDFQKLTTISPDGTHLAVAGTRDLTLLRYPSLEAAALPVHLFKGEFFDAAFSSSSLVVATTINLLVYALPSPPESVEKLGEKKAGKQKEVPLSELELIKTIERPNLPGKNAGSSFRSLRFHPKNPKVIYTIINTVPPRTRTKSSPRHAFVCKWNAETWEVIKLRKISDRGLTCFDVSPDGKLLAFGSSDYTVGILDAHTFAPVVTILKAHEFPPTTLRFNPDSNLLISGSADNTIRVVTVPEYVPDNSWSSWLIVAVTLLILLFAFIAQQMH